MTTSLEPISVITISMGRPDCLLDLTRALNAQTRPPDHIVFVVTDPTDIPPNLDTFSVTPRVIIAPQGTCHQRNIGIDTLPHTNGITAFFDDDYLPAPTALAAIERAFDIFGPEIAGMSGHLIADGINGPGIPLDAAQVLITANPSQSDPTILKDTIGLYGCNMALRTQAIGVTRFDENLPLYAWQEDVDFSHRVGKHSNKRMIRTNAFCGVHRGVKSGRAANGTRLGYSQVANNWYLWKHSGLPGPFALRVALRNIIANHAKSLHSEPWIDRRGRARGNRIALAHLLTGRLDPQHIHTL